MNTAKDLPSTGRVHFGAYTITFCTDCEGSAYNWIELYDANVDDTFTKRYDTVEDVLNTIPLLMTSAIMREEFCK
jgi:hypothetical protein